MVVLLATLLAAFAGDALRFEVVNLVQHGVEAPALVMHLGEPGRLEADVSCGGRTWRLARAFPRGARAEVRLEGIAAGTHACSARVFFLQDNGADGEESLTFSVTSLPPLEVEARADDVDHARRSLVLQASRELADAVAVAYGARGAVLGELRADLSDARRPRFDYGGLGEVVKLTVRATDAHGLWREVELVPWHYEIPHEDVVFDTGLHQIPAAQVPKLEAAWSEVVRLLDLYGSVIRIDLYVGGFTDTVGDRASNQALSERRARAIADWFRKRGFSGDVWYQGFGEDGLAVGTADEVEEARNRRAIYLLGNRPPPAGAVPRSAWRKL